MTDPQRPRTAAGRALLARTRTVIGNTSAPANAGYSEPYLDAILAIEAEAATLAAPAGLREALEDVASWLEAEAEFPRIDPHPAMRIQARYARAALGAAPPSPEPPREGRVDLFATALQAGRVVVHPGDEAAAMEALRVIGASSFTVALEAAPRSPEPPELRAYFDGTGPAPVVMERLDYNGIPDLLRDPDTGDDISMVPLHDRIVNLRTKEWSRGFHAGFAASPAPIGLDELRALSEAATAGTWLPVARAGDYTDMSEIGEMLVIGTPDLRPRGDADTRGVALAKPANAAFIVAAVNYVRDLLRGTER